MKTHSNKITNTQGFLSLMKDSEGRNRGPRDTQELYALLDPNGYHVAGWTLLHNDVEWRVQWAMKMKGSDDPVFLWMDNGFDAFEKYTVENTVEQPETPAEIKAAEIEKVEVPF